MAGNLLVKHANGASSKARKHLGFSSTISSSFAISTGQAGLCWNGTNVIYTTLAGADPCHFMLGTGFGSTVQNSFDISQATLLDCMDLDHDGTNIMFTRGGSGARKLWRTTGFSSTIGASASTFSPFYPRGLCWDGTNLFYGGYDDDSHTQIKKCSGFSATIIDSLEFTAYIMGYGMTQDGSNLILANQDGSKFYQYTGFSTSVADSFASYAIMGMDWDGFPVPPSASLTGTITSATAERQILAGGKTIILTLSGTNVSWIT